MRSLSQHGRRRGGGSGLALVAGLALLATGCGSYEPVDLAQIGNLLPQSSISFAGSSAANGLYFTATATRTAGLDCGGGQPPGTYFGAVLNTPEVVVSCGQLTTIGLPGRYTPTKQFCPGTYSFTVMDLYEDASCLDQVATCQDKSQTITAGTTNIIDVTCTTLAIAGTFDVVIQ